MSGFVEMFFSAYLVPSPPFFALLRVAEIEFSSRVKLFCYGKPNGEVVKYRLLADPSKSKPFPRHSLRSIEFALPDRQFLSFLMEEHFGTVPWASWYFDKNAGPYIWYGGYQWQWMDDWKYLVVYDETKGFTLENREAKLLARIIFGAARA